MIKYDFDNADEADNVVCCMIMYAGYDYGTCAYDYADCYHDVLLWLLDLL